MATGFSPKLPLVVDPDDGHVMNKTILDAVRQNLKMLILTSPGERVMDPAFGVGLKHWMFRIMNNQTFSEIATTVGEQISLYMPYIHFHGVGFETNAQDENLPANQIRVQVQYRVVAMGITDQLDLLVGLANAALPVNFGD
jgi:hypothetical protein